MRTPAIAVSYGHHVSRIGKIIPDMREFTEEISRLPRTHYIPDLLCDKEFYGYLSKGKEWKSVLFKVNVKMHSWNSYSLMSGPAIDLTDAFPHDFPDQILINFVIHSH